MSRCEMQPAESVPQYAYLKCIGRRRINNDGETRSLMRIIHRTYFKFIAGTQNGDTRKK